MLDICGNIVSFFRMGLFGIYFFILVKRKSSMSCVYICEAMVARVLVVIPVRRIFRYDF
ncbi:hypothetical protein Hanom_Chr01g00060741 [Helianthus anomalus]